LSKRAERRHHRQRMIDKIKWLQKYIWGGSLLAPRNPDDLNLEAKKLADNPTFCKHVHCQNPRKVFGQKPLKELAAEQPCLHEQPCEICGAAWNEACEKWCNGLGR
jgi:hypothetical protein